MQSRKPSLGLLLLLLTTLAVGCSAPPVTHKVRLGVQVLYADPGIQDGDGRSRQLLATLPSLPPGRYTLRDEAQFELEPHTAGRLQLPDRTWLDLTPQEINPQGQARLTVDVSGVQLHATVLLTAGSTLAIGGASFGRGHLVVAIRYL
jgi:hypothetical protein